MDARPFRPQGAENMVPSLHQRHKSTGNIAGMASNVSAAGFRGPAKRAAFGDVTNMAKGVASSRDGPKVHKVQSVADYSKYQSNLNKENFVAVKDCLSYSSKKPSASTKNKPAALEATTEKDRGHGDPDTLNQENVVTAPVSAEDSHNAVNVYMPDKPPRGLQSSLNAPPIQPRHYKSQPQLKQQQHTLRRTQSRQLERTDPRDYYASTSDEIEPVAVSHLQESNPVADEVYADALDMHMEYNPVAELKHEDTTCADIPSNLSEILEEPSYLPAADTCQPQGLEEEEYWDEEDDEYDDQDQAYMTAHSFKSHDMTLGGATTVLQPRVTARVQRELEEARQEVMTTRTAEDIVDEAWDITIVAEYGEDIFAYLRELEIRMLPNPHYMENQTEIQWSMRSVLMEWLVQVHLRFNLLPETLFLTVNYVDRFLSHKVISIGKLQLVGATAILVASKYEEINCPSLKEIVYMVDKGYSAEEILKAERFMLSMLGFELGWPGPMSFLRRVSKADDYDLDTRTLAKYFLELTIMDERFVASPPSFLAAGAHCLSRLVLGKGHWTKHHVHYSSYTWGQLKPLVTMMIECCKEPERHHAAIYEKYAEKKFKQASIVVQDALDAGFTLPHHSMPVRPLQPQPLYLDEDRYRHHLLPVDA